MVSQDPLVNATVTDLGTTWQVNFKTGSLAFWTENHDEVKLFNVLQFHMHSPSEHTFDGDHYDMELHIVHQSYDQKELAVLGVLFDLEEGGEHPNDFIASLKLDTFNKTSWVISEIPLMTLINKLDLEKVYHYEGSLTTPPCSEVVNWLVVHDVQPISTEQLALFTNKWMGNATFGNGYGNNRATKPLNGRTIYYAHGESAAGYVGRVMAGIIVVVVGISVEMLL